jgi:hypothetical protein
MADLDAIRTHLAAWHGLADWAKEANGRRAAGVLAEDCESLLAEVERLRDGIRKVADSMDLVEPDRTLVWEDDLRALLDDRKDTT